tara:strand:+ start:1996 stop:2670 length:675 start_codon:yes stop_codon:yes gene_type:complete
MIKPKIIKEKRKSISIQVKTKDSIIVKAPLYVPNYKINQFIESKQKWIQKQVSKLSTNEKNIIIPFEDNQNILYLGKKYIIKQSETALMHPLTFTDKFLLYNKINTINTHEYITKHLKDIAKEIITDKITEISNKISLIPNSIKIKSLTSRWGSCSSKKNVNLNWKLIHAPLNCIEYVIIHELVHLIHMNHSKIFWNEVENHCPTFKTDKKWLDDFGNFISFKY